VTTSTRSALQALGTRTAPAQSTATQRAVDSVTGWLAARTSRRGFLARTGVVASAIAVDASYVLRPGTAYASVCGDGASCSSGWTVFCATINNGVNACPPGSIAAGWWKADGASLCGGSARYIIDCNATCSRCSGGGRAGICSPSCWSCSCTCGPSGQCDQRRTCCNAFRYGQCNQQVAQVGAVHCRVVSCTPPWKFEKCSTAPATDNRTREHSSPALPTAFTAISRRYVAMGENGSVLGATIRGEAAVPGGTAQRYQRGRISHSAATGAHETVGPISTRYVALGAEGGLLGFPTSGRIVQAAGTVTWFQRGRISHSPATGAWETVGAIAARYRQTGAEGGPLGYPVAGEAATADGGRVSTFQHGRISYSPVTGAPVLRGPILAAYLDHGAETGSLGFPTAEETDDGSGRRRSDFEHGTIRYDPATGAVTVQEGAATSTATTG
jgi:LGFP repeat